MELGESISIDDQMAGLFATELKISQFRRKRNYDNHNFVAHTGKRERSLRRKGSSWPSESAMRWSISRLRARSRSASDFRPLAALMRAQVCQMRHSASGVSPSFVELMACDSSASAFVKSRSASAISARVR